MRQKEKTTEEATAKEMTRRRRGSYLQAVDGGGAAPLMLEYTGISEGEEEEGEEEAAEEVASSLGSARRQLLLEDGDFISDAERARMSPEGAFAVTRRSLEARKKRGAGAGAGVEGEQLGLALPPPGAAQAAAPAVPPSPGWKRENAGQRQRGETPRRESLSVDYGEASGGGVLALRTPQPGEPSGGGDEERAVPPLHGEYLKMIVDTTLP